MNRTDVAQTLLRIARELTRDAAGTVSDKDIAEIADLTDGNDHAGALLVLYEKVLKNRKATNALKAIITLQDYFGHTPDELYKLRFQEFYKPAMKAVEQKFDTATAERIHGAF